MSSVNFKTIESVSDFRQLRSVWRANGATVGFVPTMGALHQGHLSLLERALAENTHVVVSIFVNPTQFNQSSDLQNYPRPLAQDLDLLKGCLEAYKKSATLVALLPQASDIYSDQFRFVVSETQMSQVLCGPGRPGHFSGVLTVVLKLFNIVQPHRSYFGEKDFQQLRLIQDMVHSLFLDVDVVPCATVREPDGLAMSSRNQRLTPEQRALAPEIYRALTSAVSASDAKAELSRQGFQVEYVEDLWGRRFVAASLGEVRLIDNVTL